MPENGNGEPTIELRLGESRVTLLGTAHVSRASADKVKELLASGDYDAVAVELCPSRRDSLIDPEAIAKMDLFKVVREGKAPTVAASLALGAYQQRLADQLGIEPGAEQRQAIRSAEEKGLPVLLIDREIGVTMKRLGSRVPWWRRIHLLTGLVASLISQEKVDEAEIERLKEGDVLESTFAQFADQERDLYEPLIEERDRYMAARLGEELSGGGHASVLVVLGAGHLQGVAHFLRESGQEPARTIAELDRLPAPSAWPKSIPWLIVLLILLGFGVGFSRSSELGWQMVADWVIINGGLSALGALLAAAHPVTVVTAFLAAPLTSLNPTIGAGMVTAAVEVYLRKPTVGDFSRLRAETTGIWGWWRNRVSRTLLIFLLSSLGSAAGTYLAGFRIFGRLAGE